jgi:hypothetical protein
MDSEAGESETVEKLMSIRRDEFEAGLKRLTGSELRLNGADGYLLGNIGKESQTVRCSFEALPDAVLGKLLALPRARVRLHLTGLSSDARTEFLTLFDRTFQRGGG